MTEAFADTEERSEQAEGGLGRGRPAAGQDPIKREQIMEGARRVFMDKGFDAASMNDVTREAGVSKGTIYVYFDNKEELFEALVEEERGKIFQNLYEVLEREDNLRDILEDFGMALSYKITSDKVVMAQRVVIGAAERIPELGLRFYERGPKTGHAKVEAFLNRAVEKGLLAISDIDLAAYQLSELCLAGLLRQRLYGYRRQSPADHEIRHVVRSGVDVFLKAYGTEAFITQDRARRGD